MDIKEYKVVTNVIGEYSIRDPNGLLIIGGLKYKTDAQIITYELNKLYDNNKELEHQLIKCVQSQRV